MIEGDNHRTTVSLDSRKNAYNVCMSGAGTWKKAKGIKEHLTKDTLITFNTMLQTEVASPHDNKMVLVSGKTCILM